jgi:hypothetical protein
MGLLWSPSVATSPEEDWVLRHCKKAKLFVFLRAHRHELFDDDFQKQLAGMYSGRTAGKEPIAPALLAMVTLLQAAMGVSDEDAVEFALMDQRWQMLLGTLGSRVKPFEQGSLFNFRQRLMAKDMDKVLLERSIALAQKTRGFSPKALRAAFDASPLFGAGRVEDTFNLIGHAARELLQTVADRLGLELEAAAERAGIPLVTGSSLKASLDIDWDDAKQKKAALELLLKQVSSLAAFVERELKAELEEPPLAGCLATLAQVLGQDIEPDPEGGGARIKQGTAKERRISVRDGQMRHGRKSKTSRVDGYKRHVAVDIETKLIIGVAVTPANRPEAEAAPDLLKDVKRQPVPLVDLYIDRGYLASAAVNDERVAGVEVHCKAFPLHNANRFTKADFVLDLDAGTLRCPAGQTVACAPGTTARFPTKVCGDCPRRAECTTATGRGRSVAIHEQEAFFVELRRIQKTREGRAELRKRVTVEHSLAAISRSQGKRARYVGLRRNLFDLRRHAAVENLYVAARAA